MSKRLKRIDCQPLQKNPKFFFQFIPLIQNFNFTKKRCKQNAKQKKNREMRNKRIMHLSEKRGKFFLTFSVKFTPAQEKKEGLHESDFFRALHTWSTQLNQSESLNVIHRMCLIEQTLSKFMLNGSNFTHYTRLTSQADLCIDKSNSVSEFILKQSLMYQFSFKTCRNIIQCLNF